MKTMFSFGLILYFIGLTGCAINPYSILPDDQKPQIIMYRINGHENRRVVVKDRPFVLEVFVNTAVDSLEISFYELKNNDPLKPVKIWPPSPWIAYVGDEKVGAKVYGQIYSNMGTLFKFKIWAWSKKVPKKYGDFKEIPIEAI